VNSLGGLIVFSLVMIGLLAAALHRLGRSRQVRLTSRQQAQCLFLTQFPTVVVLEVQLLAGGQGAVLAIDQGLGLLRPMGSKWLTQTIDGSELTTVECSQHFVLVEFSSFSSPRVRLEFENTALAAHWGARLAGLMV